MGVANTAKIRLALTSLEHDHAWWTIQHILEEPHAELVAVADPRQHLIEKARGKGYPGVRWYSLLEEMLDREKPDALVVTAANSEHRAIVEACAEQSIHCMVQKPMATTAADARRMDRAAHEAGIRLMVNCFPFWRPEYQELTRRLSGVDIGPLQKVVTHNGHQGPTGIGVLTSDYLAWLYDPVRHGGGAFIDQGSYGLAYTLAHLGRPATISAVMHTFKTDENTAVEDDAVAMLDYASATAVIQGSFIWPFGRTELQFYGPRGGLRLINDKLFLEEASATTDPSRKVTVPIEVPPVPAERKNGIAHFIDCLRRGTEFDRFHSAALNVLVADVVDAAYRSARTRSVVPLEP
jgi:predicted dehydrogenase